MASKSFQNPLRNFLRGSTGFAMVKTVTAPISVKYRQVTARNGKPPQKGFKTVTYILWVLDHPYTHPLPPYGGVLKIRS